MAKKTSKKTEEQVINEVEITETVQETVKEEKAVEKDLSTLTVNELREMAKEKDIKGYSTMKKAELLEALK